MSGNLGRSVKWQDDQQGWHTGQVVLYPIGGTEVEWITGFASKSIHHRLIKESCDGVLTWVDDRLLQPWQPRSEWEDKQPTFEFVVKEY